MRAAPRALIHRVGGKGHLARTILRHLPAHLSFSEAFAGSAIVTLSKKPSPQGDVINDLDANISNLFKVARDQPTALAASVALTPYSRREFDEAYAYIQAGFGPDDDPVEWARRFLVVNRQGYHGTPPLTWSMSRQSWNRLVAWNGLPETVMAASARLQTVAIECLDYQAFLQRYDGPEYCHFLDPPYMDVEAKYYDVNRDGGFDHERLRNVIKGLQGSVVVSYYERERIQKLYRGFRVIRLPVTTAINRDKQETELLLIRESGYAQGRKRGVADMFAENGVI
jgi:DNA adenine methylase